MKEIMDSFGRYTKGDWVRFYSAGKLVIGQIEYIYKATGNFIYAATDQGPVRVDSILECRPKHEETNTLKDNGPDTPKPRYVHAQNLTVDHQIQLDGNMK